MEKNKLRWRIAAMCGCVVVVVAGELVLCGFTEKVTLEQRVILDSKTLRGGDRTCLACFRNHEAQSRTRGSVGGNEVTV